MGNKRRKCAAAWNTNGCLTNGPTITSPGYFIVITPYLPRPSCDRGIINIHIYRDTRGNTRTRVPGPKEAASVSIRPWKPPAVASRVLR